MSEQQKATEPKLQLEPLLKSPSTELKWLIATTCKALALLPSPSDIHDRNSIQQDIDDLKGEMDNWEDGKEGKEGDEEVVTVDGKDAQNKVREWSKVRRGQRWKWFLAVCRHLGVDPMALPASPTLSDVANLSLSIKVDPNEQYDVVHDLVLVSLGLAGQPSDKEGKERKGNETPPSPISEASNPSNQKTPTSIEASGHKEGEQDVTPNRNSGSGFLSGFLPKSMQFSSDQSPPPAPKPEASKPVPEGAFTYTSLERAMICQFMSYLNFPPTLLPMTEKSISQSLYFIYEESQKTASDPKNKSQTQTQPQPQTSSSLSDPSSSPPPPTSSTPSLKTALAVGGTFILGGLAIGLTGGLAAAPLLAPLLAGASGGLFAFLTTTGGTVLLGTLFGVAGGGLGAWRVGRRLRGVEEFEFEQILADPELPKIPSLNVTICCSGFLLTNTDYIDPWRPTFENTLDRRDAFALKVETAVFLSAGKNLESYVRDYLLKQGATEIVKRTALAGFYAAVALPATIYSSAAMLLDNEFQRARDKARKAGLILADVLERGVQGNRPTVLIGSSLGAITIFTCLLELHRRSLHNLVHSVYLISSPMSPTPLEWASIRNVVSYRLVNAYTTNDWVLAIVARLHSLISTRLSIRVAGMTAVEVEGVENVDLSDILEGHLEISKKMKEVLERLELDK